MTNPNYTAVKLLIDRSGSMQAIHKSAESGINEFIEGQRQAKDGRRTISIAKFDYDAQLGMQYSNNPSADPAEMEPFVLRPRGGTPLLDAMGKAITEFGAELAAMPEPERPGVVILAVMTDGEENSSREYTWPQIKEMVKHQQEAYGWQVLYLGANQDAWAVGERLGVPHHFTMTYAATALGTAGATRAIAHYVNTAATGQRAGFTDKDRKDAAR